MRLYPLPVRSLTESYGRLPVIQNTVALGALCWLQGLDFDLLEGVLREMFGRKGEEIVATNVGVAQAGYDYAREQYSALESGRGHLWFGGRAEA